MNSFFGLAITVFSYFLFFRLKKISIFDKLPTIVWASVLIICVLKISNIKYEQYNQSAKIITFLLETATVSLGYPLYEHSYILIKNKRAIYLGLALATMLGVFSTYILGIFAHLKKSIIFSMLAKSITTPIAIEVSKSIGAIPELTAVIVILTGLTGAIFGLKVLKFFKIKSPTAIGISIGASSHVLGTSSLYKSSKLVAIGTISLILTAILTAIFVPNIFHS